MLQNMSARNEFTPYIIHNAGAIITAVPINAARPAVANSSVNSAAPIRGHASMEGTIEGGNRKDNTAAAANNWLITTQNNIRFHPSFGNKFPNRANTPMPYPRIR